MMKILLFIIFINIEINMNSLEKRKRKDHLYIIKLKN